ncbi:hypothetical protein LI328DRAFT_160744 [Trichoderma asperelloides]|nr:hypothetical protein LI328DRAFT_160744 [Trichoderma asperelloides]
MSMCVLAWSPCNRGYEEEGQANRLHGQETGMHCAAVFNATLARNMHLDTLVQHKRDRKSGTFTQWNSAALLAKPQHGSLIAEEQREGKKRGDKNKVHIIRPEPCIASSGTTRSRPSQAPSRRSIMETSGCGNGHDGYGTTR